MSPAGGAGEAPGVVLVHGVRTSRTMWRAQEESLRAAGHRVVAVDLPGHCKSEGEAPASVEAAADFGL